MTHTLREIVWAESAVRDYVSQIEYLESFVNEAAAILVKNRLIDAVNSLNTLPTGRIGRVSGTFEKIVPKTSLIIVYEITNEHRITIVHIIHMAQNYGS